MAMEKAQVDPQEEQKRDEIAIARSGAETARRNIIQQIKRIQPEAGKNLKDLEVPQSLYDLAREVAQHPEPSVRFKKVDVYDLLLTDWQRRTHRGPAPSPTEVMEGWKTASISLFRYALNLILAPKRAEFKKMKLSTSFYVYNISRNLYQAEKVFHSMGYRSVDKKEKKEGQDLVYEGEVNLVPLLETATDLLVMHEEVGQIQSRMWPSGGHSLFLENTLTERKREYDEASGHNSSHPAKAAQHEGLHQQCNPRIQQSGPSGAPGYVNMTVGSRGPGGPPVHVPPEPTASPAVTGVSEYHKRYVYEQQQMNSQVPGCHQHQTVQPPQSQPYITPQPVQQFSTPHQSQQYPTQDVTHQYPTSDPSLYPYVEQLPQYGQPQYDQLPPTSHQQDPLHQPPLSSQSSSQEWGKGLTNPTIYQNFPLTASSDINSPGGSTSYSAVSSHQTTTVSTYSGSSHQMVHPTNKSSSPQKPIPAPRKTAPPPQQQQTVYRSTDHPEEKMNIQRLSMEAQQQQQWPQQRALSSSDGEASLDIAAGLPPPMTLDFTSPGTPHYESGIMSGIDGVGRQDDSGITFDPSEPREPGPLAMRSVESSVTSSTKSSIDIYSSGPRARKQSSPLGISPVPEEPGPPHTTTPALVTQGSQDSAPHELRTDYLGHLPPRPCPLSSKYKAQSVDECERERDQAVLTTSSSAADLMELERRSRLNASQKALLTSNQSPSSSPNSQRRSSRDHTTHEEWTPPITSSSHTSSPPHPPVKPRKLPPKSQSVEVERQGNQEVTRFSSGSNLLPIRGSSGQPRAVSQSHTEPDTPVVGIIPPGLQRMRQITTSKSSDPERTPHSSSTLDGSTDTRLAANTQPQPSGSDTAPPYEPSTQPSHTLLPTERSQDSNQDSSNQDKTQTLPPPLPNKTRPNVSPTTAVAGQAATSKPDESNLDYCTDGVDALRQVKQTAGLPRERANAVHSRKREKPPPTAQEEEISFMEKPANNSVTENTDLEITLDLVSDIEQKFSINLSETWECSYCTQLNSTSLASCEVCHRHRETVV